MHFIPHSEICSPRFPFAVRWVTVHRNDSSFDFLREHQTLLPKKKQIF
jgi:hypothetical protein